MPDARSVILLLDAVINVVLGVALLFFSWSASFLGIPEASNAFYPTILGGVLFGIGLALLWEAFRSDAQPPGLGLAGAIAINLSGGFVLILWLLLGDLSLPLRGRVILWTLAFALVTISVVEVAARRRR
jgi:hypothetical protein